MDRSSWHRGRDRDRDHREVEVDVRDKDKSPRGRDKERDRPHRSSSRSDKHKKSKKAKSKDRKKDKSKEDKRHHSNSSGGHKSSSGRRKDDKKDRDRDDKGRGGGGGGRDRDRDRPRSKDKKRSPSPSDDSDSSDISVSSGDSVKLMMKLEEERKHQLEEMRKRKEMQKAMETPEEKRQRRLAKKGEKEKKRKERMGWDKDYLSYTNTDNPFGDSNITETFVWKKKLEKVGLKDISREEVERINRLKQEENKRELEKVKKARMERELERAARDEEQQLLQRQKEAAQFMEWGNQEDVFHLEQARLRSKIRIKDGRAKPIDLLAQYISAEEEVDAIEMHEPYTYLNGLTIQDLEDLIEDIKVYREIEQNKNLSYWNDITVIVEDELRKLRKLEQDDDYRVALERREGINSAVSQDVAQIFKGKTAEQLQALKHQIQSKLDGSSSGVDISYWESLLSQLKAHIARAQLRDRHQDNLKRKLALLKAEQGVADSQMSDSPGPAPGPSFMRGAMSGEEPVKVEHLEEASQESFASGASASAHNTSEIELDEEDEDEEDDESKEYVDETIIKYEQGGYSPKIITQEEIEPGIFVIGEEEDNARLDLARAQVLKVGQKVENVWTAEEKALQNEAKKGMTNDEAKFSVETPVDQIYLWSDKYRPRKPRYFNRVHTGFEWNKYNQTHYDMDNPPPKIVQGYKFNIFYPDLIDKNTTPQYHLTTCKDNPDFSILRFHAGPPYEDIAFKIVNREWEYSYKRGFRCQFQNNIFQLWFHFKRYRYRR